MSLSTRSPCRAAALGFAATWNRTSPLPWPDVGVIPVIQAASDAALHAHSGCAATVTAPAPPADVIADGLSVTATWHFTGVGPAVVSEEELQPAAAAKNRATANARRPTHEWQQHRGQMELPAHRGARNRRRQRRAECEADPTHGVAWRFRVARAGRSRIAVFVLAGFAVLGGVSNALHMAGAPNQARDRAACLSNK